MDIVLSLLKNQTPNDQPCRESCESKIPLDASRTTKAFTDDKGKTILVNAITKPFAADETKTNAIGYQFKCH